MEQNLKVKLYKKLLDKGFKPIYYINADLFEFTNLESRIVYNLDIDNKDLIQIIFQNLNVYDDFSHTLLHDNIKISIKCDEKLSEISIIVHNKDCDGFIVKNEYIDILFNILPNKFIFEHLDV